MPINQKNKIIIASLAFLMLGVLIFWKTSDMKTHGGISTWDMLTARPVPSTQYPTPGVPFPIPSSLPIISSNYLGLLPWAVRLASKEMPHIEGVVWKTYTNKEYGFEMQYPEGWKINTDIQKRSGRDNYGVYEVIYFSFTPHDETRWDYFPLTLSHHRNKDLAEYLGRLYKESRGDNFRPIIKTIIINDINWLVDDPDAYDIGSPMYAEKNDYIYQFGGTSFPTRNESMIAEYMIKSFHFVQ